MDRIITSYLTEFQKTYNFESEILQSTLFEHFVNYVVTEAKLEDSLDEEQIEKICIGRNGTIGLDGFALIINGHLITEKEDLDSILDLNKNSKAELIFIQSKTSTSFNIKEIGLFGDTIEDFISETPKYDWTENARDCIDLFNQLLNRVSELAENPKCYLYYVTLGLLEENQNLIAQKEKIISKIKAQNVFSAVEFKYIDNSSLQSDFKKIGQSIAKSFEFTNKVLIPDITKVTESYIGIIPSKTIVDLMTDEDGEIINNLFYDNVRDFQGDNKINNKIEETLDDTSIRDAFSILNNGITIVAEEIKHTRNTVTITNYQFINGLQTSHVLFNKKESLTNEIQVPLKLIITKNEDLISKIIRSTNSQTPVSEEDLIAYSGFQKRLEDFYKTFSDSEKLYYERRSKQYNKTSIERKKIVDKTTQIKTIGSMVHHKPNMATRYFGTLLKEFGSSLFQDNHKMIPYYTCAFVLFKLEELFRTNQIDKKYRKLRFFILMMIGLEISTLRFPKFESKNVEIFCESILEKVKNEIEFKKLIKNTLNKIDSLNEDLNSLELSKSRKLVDDLKAFYFPKTKS